MKRCIAFLLILHIAFILGCDSGPEQTEEAVIPVQVFEVQPDSIAKSIEITGTLEAVDDARVHAKVSEKLEEIRKEVGSRVTRDEVIAVLENTIWEQGSKQAEAALESARARYNQVKGDYERYQKLYRQEAVSEQQWEQIRSSWQDAQAGLNRAEAAYQQAKEQLENTFIKAPFNGIVGSLYFDQGEMVPQGQPVARIVNANLMKAKLNIPDIYIDRVKIGQPVKGQFSSGSENVFTGKINRVDPAIDPLSRTFQAEAVFTNNDNGLTSGMYGVFRIEIVRHTNTFVLPDNSLIRRTDVEIDPETGETNTRHRNFVFVVSADTARLSQVETGLEAYGRVEIIEGLQKSSKVIVRGQKIVKEGQRVKVVQE